jgi:hypothetical protein
MRSPLIQADCQQFCALPNATLETGRICALYASLKGTLAEFATLNPQISRIDLRKFIIYGVLKGFIGN